MHGKNSFTDIRANAGRSFSLRGSPFATMRFTLQVCGIFGVLM